MRHVKMRQQTMTRTKLIIAAASIFSVFAVLHLTRAMQAKPGAAALPVDGGVHERPPLSNSPAAASRLASKTLEFPVACSLGETCAIQNYVDLDEGPGAKDFKDGTRSYDGHNGTDIRLRSYDQQKD